MDLSSAGGNGRKAGVSTGGTPANGKGAASDNKKVGHGSDATPTLSDVFDKKSYYSLSKIKSRLTRQLEKYERLLEESEERMANLKLQMMDPALASDYEKLMELQNGLEAEEQTQESLLERMLETETQLQDLEGV